MASDDGKLLSASRPYYGGTRRWGGDGTGAGGSRGGRSHHLPGVGARGAAYGNRCREFRWAAVALRCDYYRRKERESCRQGDARELGGVDILVNNAANYETAEFDQLTLNSGRHFASNTRDRSGFAGSFATPAGAQGKNHQYGIAGRTASVASHAHYCSSKAAVHMLTKVMQGAAPEIAVELRGAGMIDLERRRQLAS